MAGHFTKRYSVNFYSLGKVITHANFLGFAREDQEDLCRHKGCGFSGPYKVCLSCGEHTPKGRYSHWFRKDECHSCYSKTGPVQHPPKVKCKMKRFRTLNKRELADPNREIRFALLQVGVSGESGAFEFIVDLEAKTFSDEMRVDWNHKTETYVARPTDKRKWSKLKIDKVENKVAIIDKIWESFS